MNENKMTQNEVNAMDLLAELNDLGAQFDIEELAGDWRRIRIQLTHRPNGVNVGKLMTQAAHVAHAHGYDVTGHDIKRDRLFVRVQ